MRFQTGTEVFTADGQKIGAISRIVIDAKTREVTDLVVDRGILSVEERVIPLSLVDLENDERLMLRETNQEIDDFPKYETSHYVDTDDSAAPYENVRASYWFPPVDFQAPIPRTVPDVVPDRPIEPRTSIPEGRIAISEGARVLGSDERHIGNVERVIVNPETNALTHFVVGKGLLLKEHKLVPAGWVSDVDDDRIRLSVASRLFERLPDYRPE